MGVTIHTTAQGHIVRIHDPIEPNSPEWEQRQKRWEKASVKFWADKEREVAKRH